VTRARSWLAELAPILARYLIAFFIGVITTLAWQSYRDGSTIDRLAAEITKVQDILERTQHHRGVTLRRGRRSGGVDRRNGSANKCRAFVRALLREGRCWGMALRGEANGRAC